MKVEYKTTVFCVTSVRGGDLSIEDPKPPADGWRLVNFHPLMHHPDSAKNYFVAVWEIRDKGPID